MKFLLSLITVFVAWFLTPLAYAQNVTGYDAMSNPMLLLLREPAVLDDLRLNGSQRTKLQAFNDTLDGDLLAHRNWPPEKARVKFGELVDRTHAGLESIFTADQRERLQQIMLRVRGTKLVLVPSVVEKLQLTDAQQTKLESAVKEAADGIAELQKQLQSGAAFSEIEAASRKVREREQREVVRQLTDTQRRQLAAVIGRSFDTSKLGRVKLKAPEFIDAGGWININRVRIADLRGEVIAVHFWAFG